MEAGILYIFSFSIILSFSFCTTKKWYEKLPIEQKHNSKFIIGEYKKKVYSTKPMLSKIYMDEVYESLKFFDNGSFEKKITKVEINYGIKTTTIIKATGTYTQNGNWLLLEYPGQLMKFSIDNDNKEEKFKGYALLYYYEESKQFIIPMICERELKLENFGVKDFVNTPYKDDEKQFRIGLSIYSEKENRSHAYYIR